MPSSRVAIGLFAVTFACVGGATDIYKCVGREGRTAFQDSPCEGTATGEKLIVHPNVVVPIDQSESISASRAISERVSARRRAVEDAEFRERMVQQAAAAPPPPQPSQEPAYFNDYAPYAYFPPVRQRTERVPRPQTRSHVPVEERKRR